jgi:hypothetical protein
MMLRGLRSPFCKAVAIVAAAILNVTLVPSQGRSEEVHTSVLYLLIEMARPMKPQANEPTTWHTAPRCPMGVCTGAAVLPCCPMRVNKCVTDKPVPGCECAPCLNGQTSGCQSEGCCEGVCGKPECSLAEIRRLCAEQARALREMQRMLTEMHATMNALQVEVQLLSQNPVVYPNYPQPMYYNQPAGSVPNPQQIYYNVPNAMPAQPMPMPVTQLRSN